MRRLWEISAVCVSLLAGACGETETTAPGGEVIFFPVHHETDAPDALGFGVLTEVDECLAVLDPGGAGGLLPIWPEGIQYEDGTLIDSDGTVLARAGDEVALGGGEVSVSVFGELTGLSIPTSCSNLTPFMVANVRVA